MHQTMFLGALTKVSHSLFHSGYFLAATIVTSMGVYDDING